MNSEFRTLSENRDLGYQTTEIVNVESIISFRAWGLVLRVHSENGRRLCKKKPLTQ